jgi:hypothetical protein
MSFFTFPGYMKNPGANMYQAPPIPGQFGNMAAYFPVLQRAADRYRSRADKRRKRSIGILKRSIEEETRRLKGAAITRAMGSGLATSSAVGTAAGQAGRYRTAAMGQVADRIAAPPQYEQDPFYNAMLQQWLMANQGLISKGVRQKQDNSGAWAGMAGQLGGALIGGLFSGGAGAAAGGTIGGQLFGAGGGAGSSFGAIPGSFPWGY